MNLLTRFILSRAIKRAAKKSSLINLPIATYANDYITHKIILDGWFEKRELYAVEKFFSSMQLDKKRASILLSMAPGASGFEHDAVDRQPPPNVF